MSGKKRKSSKKSSRTSMTLTTKENRSLIAAKRKRMGLSATDSDDANQGKAYDPQILSIAHHRVFMDAFESKTGSVHGTMDYSEFRSAIDSMDLQIVSGNSLKAFTEVQDEDELDLEAFMNAVHIAYPTYDVVWQQLIKNKFKYQPSDEMLMLSEIQSILSYKKGEWKDKTRALRFMTSLICNPLQEDIDTVTLFKQLMPSFAHAFRSNHPCVIREVCICLGTIAKAKKACIKGSMIKLINLCWEILDVQQPLIRFSAQNLTQLLIRFVPDSNDNKVLKTLVQGLSLLDFRCVQETCYTCILLMMKRNSSTKVTVNAQFWGIIKNVIINGLLMVYDNEFVAGKTFELLVALEKYQSLKSARIIEPMNNKMRERYDSFKENKKSGSNPLFISNSSVESNSNRSGGLLGAKKGRHILKVTYQALREQLEHLVVAYDANDDGILTVEETLEFLRDLLDLNGPSADIALRGIDAKRSGHIKQGKIFKYVIEHNDRLFPNPLLEEDARKYGWFSSLTGEWSKRVGIYEQLMDIEKQDRNYCAIFDLDHRICVLKYLIKRR